MTIKVDERARIAAAIATRRTPNGGLPEDVRQDAIAYTRRRKAQGASHATIARELALTTMTVGRWLAMGAKPKPTPTKPAAKPKSSQELRPVRVVETSKPARTSRVPIIVTTASGLRVEGLSAEDVIALLRAIG